MSIKKIALVAVPLVVIGALVGWRFSQKKAQEGQLSAQTGSRQGATPTVEVSVAAQRVVSESLSTVGTAEAPFRVDISPKSSGRIEYLQVREGDKVKPGQVLVRVDPSELQAAVAQQQANVAEARSRLAQAQLNQGPTEVGVSSQIQQQKAGLGSANSDLNQVQQNYAAQVAAADSAVNDAQAKVRAAESQVANAKATVAKETANLTNAQTKLNRIDSLYRQGFIAAQELDDARTAVDVQQKTVDVAQGQVSAAESALSSANSQASAAKNQASITRTKGLADIQSAKSRVTQAKAMVDVASSNRALTPAYKQNLDALQSTVDAAVAQLNQAKVRLEDASLKSPIEGTVTSRTADPGALASPGQSVLVVQFLDWLFITAAVPVEESGSIVVGRPVNLEFDALPGQKFTGKISNINPAADLQSRKITFRVKLDNADKLVKPGMFARVTIPTRRVDAPVTVPRDAVKTLETGSTVTVINDKDEAEVREVKLGISDAKYAQIESGVKAGEKVVTLTFRPLRDGQKVKISEGNTGSGEKGKGGGQGGPRQGQRPAK